MISLTILSTRNELSDLMYSLTILSTRNELSDLMYSLTILSTRNELSDLLYSLIILHHENMELKIVGMSCGMLMEVLSTVFFSIFLHQEPKKGVTLLPVNERLRRKGPLTRRLFTAYL